MGRKGGEGGGGGVPWFRRGGRRRRIGLEKIGGWGVEVGGSVCALVRRRESSSPSGKQERDDIRVLGGWGIQWQHCAFEQRVAAAAEAAAAQHASGSFRSVSHVTNCNRRWGVCISPHSELKRRCDVQGGERPKCGVCVSRSHVTRQPESWFETTLFCCIVNIYFRPLKNMQIKTNTFSVTS